MRWKKGDVVCDVRFPFFGAAGRVNVTSRDGVTQVMSHEENPKMLATNPLDDTISASAALVGTEPFVRGERYLYCIAEK